MTDAADDLDEVRHAAHRYEAALVAGDVVAATAWFEDDPDVSRFGPGSAQLGPRAVAAARAAQGPTAAPTWLVDETRSLGPGVALHLAVLDRGGASISRTQVWRRGTDGWRIVHAQVARDDHPIEITR